MRPIFFSFKSINITWFMALALLAVFVSYILLKVLSKDKKEDKEKLENIFFITFISGFISARFIYVLLNMDRFISSPTAIIKISHYNLSLIGGVLGGLLALFISAKKYRMEFLKLLDKFSILFYISMTIGVWNFLFDRFLLKSSNFGNDSIRVIVMSLLFALAALLQTSLGRKYEKKHISLALLSTVMIIYHIIKGGLIF